MTAPTPEQWTDAVDWLKRLVISDSHRSDRAQTLLDALAALTAERDQACQMLAGAPHGFACATIQWKTRGCTCWKAGL